MNADIQAKIDAIKAPFQGMLDAADAIPALVDVAEKAQYDQGYADGKASVVLPDPNSPDKLFTQADMDQAVATGKSEQQNSDAAVYQPQIDALNQQVADLQAQLAAMPAPVPAQPSQPAEPGSIDELNQQIDALKVQVADLQAQLEQAKAANAQKDQAMADFKASELGKLQGIEGDFKA